MQEQTNEFLANRGQSVFRLGTCADAYSIEPTETTLPRSRALTAMESNRLVQ